MIPDADGTTLPQSGGRRPERGSGPADWLAGVEERSAFFLCGYEKSVVRKKTIQKRASIFPTLCLRIHQQFSSEENRNKSKAIPTVCSPSYSWLLEASRMFSPLGVSCPSLLTPTRFFFHLCARKILLVALGPLAPLHLET